ncbi:MAG TPA: VOC family protein [Alphaproteobacteria bacterium]|jgi:catechol 2,3-dioxygenase-like lactoylglutathione lyase family enzyme|nr:VOC family protein [Alphaproteobacteria bacterium]
MPVTALDHVTIVTKDLDASRAFYIGLLGLEEVAWRPDFPFDGAWLKVGPNAVVHLMATNRDIGDGNTQPFDHFALKVENINDTRHVLDEAGLSYREANPASHIHQIFVDDPDGVTVELSFNTDQERAEGWV